MELSKEQQLQILSQIEAHNHESYRTTIALSPDTTLESFIVQKGVFRPEIAASLHLTRYLYYNNGIFRGKRALDLMCGSGIQATVMGLIGAKTVASDICAYAVQNTQANSDQYGLNIEVVRGDLFENVNGKFDVIICNHPFFPDEPQVSTPITRAMLGGEQLIHKILDESKKFLNNNGRLVMPYYHLAGPSNDPGLRGREHGYVVEERFRSESSGGLQKGNVSIYELTLL